jgi:hypothetical protein
MRNKSPEDTKGDCVLTGATLENCYKDTFISHMGGGLNTLESCTILKLISFLSSHGLEVKTKGQK